jgi:hypothetical protein
MVPPVVLTLKSLVKVRSLKPSAWNAPPSSVTAPDPTELTFVTCRMPAEINVPPV